MPADPPRRCPDEDTLVLYLDGVLDRRRETRVRAHLNDCDTCRRVVADAVRGEDGEDGPPPDGSTDKQPTTIISGKYQLLSPLGEGGMGRVYRARHLALDRDVAIKMLRADLAGDKSIIQRFEREARASASLNGRHVVQILDIDWLPSGIPFIVMEYLEGSDLARLLATKGPLPIADALRFTLEACVGVAAAHARGIVHRDLKPHNLFLATEEGRGGTIKVLDFGLAKTEDANSMMASRSVAAVLGSPQFMSPEQIQNELVDHRTDLWSLGATLFMLLTGRPPFVAPSMYQLFRAILSDPPPRLAPLRPDIPPLLEEIVAMCLRKVPAERWATIDALANAIRNVQRSNERPTGKRFPMTAPLKHIAPRQTAPLQREAAALAEPPPQVPFRVELAPKPPPAPREPPRFDANKPSKRKPAPPPPPPQPAVRKKQASPVKGPPAENGPVSKTENMETKVPSSATLHERKWPAASSSLVEEEVEVVTVRNSRHTQSPITPPPETEVATPRRPPAKGDLLPRLDDSDDCDDDATKVR